MLRKLSSSLSTSQMKHHTGTSPTTSSHWSGRGTSLACYLLSREKRKDKPSRLPKQGTGRLTELFGLITGEFAPSVCTKKRKPRMTPSFQAAKGAFKVKAKVRVYTLRPRPELCPSRSGNKCATVSMTNLPGDHFPPYSKFTIYSIHKQRIKMWCQRFYTRLPLQTCPLILPQHN